MNDPLIRPARPEDAAAIDAAGLASARQHYDLVPGVFARPEPASSEWSAAALAAREGSIAFVAEGDAGVVGYIHAEVVDEQRPLFAPSRYGRVIHVAVAPARRNQGIGHRLVATAEAWLAARGCADVRLNVWHRNERANAFYASLGYRPMSAIVSKPCVAAASDRPPAPSVAAPAGAVHLREITAETVRAVTDLSVSDAQKQFVASNAVSLAQALFAPEAWYRAIHAGDELVGFVMLYDESLRTPPPDEPEVDVWRFMIDARHQGRGYGRAALLAVIEHVRSARRCTSLALSYVPAAGNAEPFYRKLGFEPTGEVHEGEVVMRLAFAD